VAAVFDTRGFAQTQKHLTFAIILLKHNLLSQEAALYLKNNYCNFYSTDVNLLRIWGFYAFYLKTLAGLWGGCGYLALVPFLLAL
jgi:hypothetical protein